MNELPHFARCLRRLRDDAKMTQNELAQLAGIARVTVARMELGTREPSWKMVQMLASAFGVPVAAFVDPEIIPPVEETPRRRGRPRLDVGDVKPATKSRKRSK